MRTDELSRAAGVNPETLRYYEREGLLPTPARAPNGYRIYGSKHLERLAFIRHCRSLDMPLDDIRRLLQALEKPTRDCGDIDGLVDTQLERVRLRLKSLRALEKQLRVLRAKCATPNDAAHCGILGELVSAAHGEACACDPLHGVDGGLAPKTARRRRRREAQSD